MNTEKMGMDLISEYFHQTLVQTDDAAKMCLYELKTNIEEDLFSKDQHIEILSSATNYLTNAYITGEVGRSTSLTQGYLDVVKAVVKQDEEEYTPLASMYLENVLTMMEESPRDKSINSSHNRNNIYKATLKCLGTIDKDHPMLNRESCLSKKYNDSALVKAPIKSAAVASFLKQFKNELSI